MKTLFFSFVLLISITFSGNAQKKATLYADTAVAVLNYMNEARTNPPAFAKKYLAGLKGNSADALECYEVLMKTTPRPALKMSIALQKAANDHSTDLVKNHRFSHTGTNGSEFDERISRYGRWISNVGENIQMNGLGALDIVLDLLIDSGVEGRGHRLNILDESFTVVGVSYCSGEYGQITVMDFAAGIEEK
jgi:uncharacterized protein YkwD